MGFNLEPECLHGETEKKFFVGQDVLSFIACEPELFFLFRRQVARAFGDEPKLEVATNQDRSTRGDPWPRNKVRKCYVAVLDDDPPFLFIARTLIPDTNPRLGLILRSTWYCNKC